MDCVCVWWARRSTVMEYREEKGREGFMSTVYEFVIAYEDGYFE